MASNFCDLSEFWNNTKLWLANLNCKTPTYQKYSHNYDVENPDPELIKKKLILNKLCESERQYNQRFSLLSNKIENINNRLYNLEFNRSVPKSYFKKELQNLENKITIRIDKFDEEPENTQAEIEILKKSINDLGNKVGKLNDECWINISD